ncbi:hypothetical protein BN59_01475 [Legionella massiliensis]|uniref:Antibiotic biosynthesis monooxygenase n=1 Tax=Legionella massiliensis TaxID=1034943 RepID=A0A078KZK1_9GAMM|nr:hypothetical protein [Legionella massiliensis]CDZ77193.1 hypothetical protein BN59_01475 [Legionella massiliensis]CEE12931.1 hypothetical protein BN1094_01475 [Legionella massiliensis]
MNNADSLKKASYIKLVSQTEAQVNLEKFLEKGSQLIRQTEPNTLLWFALKGSNDFAIFDVFPNEDGRAQHFAGQVAKALKENATNLVEGGWENGVLKNVNHFDIIAASPFNPQTVLSAKEASYIIFKAKPEKSQELEQFLKDAALTIKQTEPNTYFWIVLKADENTYAIFDAFADKAAQNAHFSGQVAAELQEKAENLISDGWEKGVLANVHNFQIIAVS